MHTVSENSSGVPAFLAKLWRLVEDDETNNLIYWNAVSIRANVAIKYANVPTKQSVQLITFSVFDIVFLYNWWATAKGHIQIMMTLCFARKRSSRLKSETFTKQTTNRLEILRVVFCHSWLMRAPLVPRQMAEIVFFPFVCWNAIANDVNSSCCR